MFGMLVDVALISKKYSSLLTSFPDLPTLLTSFPGSPLDTTKNRNVFVLFFCCGKSLGTRLAKLDVLLWHFLMQLTSSPHVTKRETDGERKSGYYTAIYIGKNDCGLGSISTVEQFASSFLTSARSDFTITPRMHKVSTRMSLLVCLVDTASSQCASLYLSSIDRGLPCHSKWRLVSRFP